MAITAKANLALLETRKTLLGASGVSKIGNLQDEGFGSSEF